MTVNVITGPSVALIAEPRIVLEEFQRWTEEQSISDLPKLYADTPLGRIIDELRSPAEERSLSDTELLIEIGGRQCYNAWRRGRENEEYIENILATAHGSVLAHSTFTFLVTGVSRSLTHELVRHAQGVAISQESQRYVNAKDVDFVAPPALLHIWGGDVDCPAAERWKDARAAEIEDYLRVQAEVTKHCEEIELPAARTVLDSAVYLGKMTLEESNELFTKIKTTLTKRANETARASLPNAAATKGMWTINFRALRHIIALRGAEDADLEIRRFAAELAIICKVSAPNVFRDIEISPGDFGVNQVTVKYLKP
jgi:thymidylate synthase (FAD)